MWSAGVISGGDITDNGNGTVSLTAGEAMLRTSASATAPLKSVTFPASNNMSLVNNATNYIWVDYNAGSPIIATSTVSSDYNCLNKCHLYTIVREGTELFILDGRQQNIDANRKQRKRFYETNPFDHVLGGTAIGNSGLDLNITVSAGAFYYSLNKVTHNAFDTSVAGTSVDRVFEPISKRLRRMDRGGGSKTAGQYPVRRRNRWDAGDTHNFLLWSALGLSDSRADAEIGSGIWTGELCQSE